MGETVTQASPTARDRRACGTEYSRDDRATIFEAEVIDNVVKHKSGSVILSRSFLTACATAKKKANNGILPHPAPCGKMGPIWPHRLNVHFFRKCGNMAMPNEPFVHIYSPSRHSQADRRLLTLEPAALSPPSSAISSSNANECPQARIESCARVRSRKTP